MSRDHDMISSLVRILYLVVNSTYHEVFGREFSLTFKRIAIILTSTIFLVCLIVWNHLGFFLDDVIFSDWRHMDVVKPAFIVGNARSGTTWLHRLLCESDVNIFSSFRIWEILFAPSVTWRWLFYKLYKYDNDYFFGSIYHFIRAVDRHLFAHIHVHPVGLFEYEEDEWLMAHVGLSQLLLLIFPGAAGFMEKVVHFDCCASYIHDTDGALSNAAQRILEAPSRQGRIQDPEEPVLALPARLSILSYYRQCVKRHMYFHTTISPLAHSRDSSRLVFVSKNPTFTLRVESLYRMFPDAYVVCMARQPSQSLPSMVSYISQVWGAVASPRIPRPRALEMLAYCRAHYLFPCLHIPRHPDSPLHGKRHGCLLSYERCRQHAKQAVLQLLYGILAHRAEIAPSSEETNNTDASSSWEDKLRHMHSWVDWQRIGVYLEQQELKSRRFRSQHVYDFQKCCGDLTEEQLREKFKVVYEVYEDLASS
eukprot:gene36252-43978_t